jgi:outer membrane immunogenic protein
MQSLTMPELGNHIVKLGILMNRLYIAVTLVAVSTVSTHAADLVLDEPAIEAAVHDWSGFYLGAQTGLVSGTFEDSFPPAPLASVGANDLGGGSLGIYGGWNGQFDGFVLGLDADVSYVLVSGSGENTADEVMETQLDWTAAVRGRAGVASEDWLFYVAGGVAATHAQVTISSLNGVAEDTLLGWTLGAGIEHAFDENWIGRAEYRYTDYGALGYVVGLADEGEVAFTTHTLTLGIAYRF